MILIYLARQERLDWLGLVDPLPVRVVASCRKEARYFTRSDGTKERIDLESLFDRGILEVVTPTDEEVARMLAFKVLAPNLGAELDALAVAGERGWTFVTEDRAARAFAARELPQVRVIGTGDFLADLVKAGRLSIVACQVFLDRCFQQ